MDFLSERKVGLHLGEQELRWLKGHNLVHGFVGQAIREAREKADHRYLTVFNTRNGHHSCEERVSKVRIDERKRRQECKQQLKGGRFVDC
jgi:uncharacterized protein (DUF2252 family)